MKSKWAIATAILLVAALAGIFYLHGKTFEVRLSESELQEKLNTQLPATRSYLMIFQVTLENLRCSLRGASNRVNVSLDVKLNIRLASERQPLKGSLQVSGGIKYLAERGQIFLTDPLIEHIFIERIPN